LEDSNYSGWWMFAVWLVFVLGGAFMGWYRGQIRKFNEKTFLLLLPLYSKGIRLKSLNALAHVLCNGAFDNIKCRRTKHRLLISLSGDVKNIQVLFPFLGYAILSRNGIYIKAGFSLVYVLLYGLPFALFLIVAMHGGGLASIAIFFTFLSIPLIMLLLVHKKKFDVFCRSIESNTKGEN
jgi:hypothetical protein